MICCHMPFIFPLHRYEWEKYNTSVLRCVRAFNLSKNEVSSSWIEFKWINIQFKVKMHYSYRRTSYFIYVQRFFLRFFFNFGLPQIYLSNHFEWNYVECNVCDALNTKAFKKAMLEIILLKNLEWHKQIPTAYM